MDKWAVYDVDPETGCWNWGKSRQSRGYGQIWDRRRQKPELAHRLAYMEHHGVTEIPKGLVVHHRCDNRGCVNPEHLALIPNRENLRLSPKSKLTADKVVAIRRLAAEGVTHRVIAQEFGIHKGTVSWVTRRLIWEDA